MFVIRGWLRTATTRHCVPLPSRRCVSELREQKADVAEMRARYKAKGSSTTNQKEKLANLEHLLQCRQDEVSWSFGWAGRWAM